MRVIKTLLISITILALIGGAGFVMVREALLFMGVSQIRGSLNQMRQIENNSISYFEQCRKKGVLSEVEGRIIKTIQLRFTSDHEYVVEVVCNLFSFDPIEVSQEQLPRFVTKTSRTGGIFWGEAASGVTLSVWGRSQSVGVENKKILTTALPSAVESQLAAPLTVCAGYGFSCCQPETALGSGEQLTQVTDCPRSCYSSCQTRPVVLSLSTQPVYDRETRIIDIRNNQTVTFAYVVDPQQALDARVTVDFGDGQRQQDLDATGKVEHQYSCSLPQCEYQAQITAVDDQGIESAATPISRVQVVVR